MNALIPPLTLRAQRKAETRQTVLRAARAAFELKGYCGVDVRTIARSAGLSTGAVYASFPSKAALYEAATGKTAPTPAMMEASPEMLAALTVIANASERSETMFGGKMSEVTRVFESITRVASAAIAKAGVRP